jgi:GAF domain-containing protein
MEPIPETVEAVNELDPADEEIDLLAHLVQLAGRGKQIVPDLVGVSIARLELGLTFTLVATTAEIATLDGIQYVAGGPCVTGAHTNQVREFNGSDILDEETWRLFAAATAAHAIHSTLTLPVVAAERVVGTVNLYAASPHAFVGHHDELAEVFGAWAAGAVANADLSFTTRSKAEEAPRKVREKLIIDVATGIVAAQLGVDVQAAEACLRDAAARADVSAAQLARDILRTRQGPDGDER